ncbi:MAG: UPF0758 domain-containing protein, partial [Pseudolabrys sp.]
MHVHEKAPQNGRTAGVSETRPHFYGHRERLRGRFREAGADSVSDYELLELVLFRAIPQRDVKLLAKDLIARFGAFPEVISAPPTWLAETKGIGEAVITELKVVHAAASRLVRVKIVVKKNTIPTGTRLCGLRVKRSALVWRFVQSRR